MKDEKIDALIHLAQHRRGWVFREYPPQRARLLGGCELIVIPAWLWRPRPHLQTSSRAEVIQMRRTA